MFKTRVPLTHVADKVGSDNPLLLNSRQEEELPEVFCKASCEIGSCNAGGCGAVPFLGARSQDSWAQANASAHWLGKRVFSDEDPNTYIPAVFAGTASDMAYFGNAKNFQGRTGGSKYLVSSYSTCSQG